MNCCALFAVTRGGVNVRWGGGVRQSEDRAVTAWDRSRRHVRLCRTFLGMKFTVMKRTFFLLASASGCSRSRDGSDRLVRVSTLFAL
jgi:hypothetical protein